MRDENVLTMGRRISNIYHADSIGISEKKIDEDVEKNDPMLIEQLSLSLRSLSEVRYLCFLSKMNFRIAERLEEKAERMMVESKRYRQRYSLRGGKYALFQEVFHRDRAHNYKLSAQDHLRRAFTELNTAYLIINKNGKTDWPPETETNPTTIMTYNRTFGFLQKRYRHSMAHVGAGKLPSFWEYKRGKTHNVHLAKIISDRQLKLLTTVIKQVEEDLKNSRIAVIKRLYLRYVIPWLASYRTFHRGDVLVIQ